MPQLEGHRLGEADHRGLADDVADLVADRHHAGDRGDVDDRPRLPPDHLKGGVLRAVVGTVDVDVHHFDEEVVVVLLDGAALPRLRRVVGGVVDEDVDAAPRRGMVDHPPHLVEAADVAVHVRRRVPEPGGRLLPHFVEDVADDDGGPVGDEVLGDLPADAARRPGDHRDAVRKVESVVHHPLS